MYDWDDTILPADHCYKGMLSSFGPVVVLGNTYRPHLNFELISQSISQTLYSILFSRGIDPPYMSINIRLPRCLNATISLAVAKSAGQSADVVSISNAKNSDMKSGQRVSPRRRKTFVGNW